MSDQEHHDHIYATFCGPRLDRMAAEIKDVRDIQGNAAAERAEISTGLAEIKVLVTNGITSRVKAIEWMQRWQMVLLGSILAAVAGAIITKVF